jgi:hypothetical protein
VTVPELWQLKNQELTKYLRFDGGVTFKCAGFFPEGFGIGLVLQALQIDALNP